MRKCQAVLTVVAATVGILFVAGGAFAAGNYIITSTHQIKPSVLSQLRGHRGPRGFTGAPGAQGLQGPQGAQGSPGVVPQIKIVESPHETLNPGQNTFNVDPNNFKATCPAGYTVLGTGFNASIGKATDVQSYGGFFVGGFVINDTSIQLTNIFVQAICGVVPGGATTASVHSPDATYHAMLARLNAEARH